MEKSSKTNENKYLVPPPEAVISRRQGFRGAAHGIIVGNYRLNLTCHCEECHRHDEAISLNKVDSMLRDCHATPAAPLAMTWNEKRKAAFTLAETLITLMVIGVVAVLTIPALMQQIGDYTLEKQRTVFEKKFAEGLRQMRVDDKLAEKYSTTEDFVNEMGKYFKISTVCEKDKLVNCFTTNQFTYHDNLTDLTFYTDQINTTDDIATVTGHNLGYDTDVMGVVLSDGVQMLITVNPDCEGIASGDTNGNHTSCFKYIADVNGKKSPSAVGKDIMSNINMSALDFEIASLGAVAPGSAWGPINGDYWLGAKEYCEGLTKNGGGWKLPTEAQLKSMADVIYKNSGACECQDNGDGYYECMNYDTFESTCDMTKLNANPLWQSITGGNGYAYLWSSVPYNDSGAYGRGFHGHDSDYGYANRDDSTISALCVR